MAEDVDAGVDLGDVAQDSGSDAVFGEGVEVFLECAARVGALLVRFSTIFNAVVGIGIPPRCNNRESACPSW